MQMAMTSSNNITIATTGSRCAARRARLPIRLGPDDIVTRTSRPEWARPTRGAALGLRRLDRGNERIEPLALRRVARGRRNLPRHDCRGLIEAIRSEARSKASITLFRGT